MRTKYIIYIFLSIILFSVNLYNLYIAGFPKGFSEYTGLGASVLVLVVAMYGNYNDKKNSNK